MKIRTFSPEGQEVVDYISVMSLDENTEEVLEQKIAYKVADYQRYLKLIESNPNKEWRQQRSVLALFFSYCMHYYDSNGVLHKNDTRTTIECFQKIKSGEALKDARFITEGLKYGIILLSPDEINYLIKKIEQY